MAYGDRPSGRGKQTNNKYGPASVGGEMACSKDKMKKTSKEKAMPKKMAMPMKGKKK